MSIRDILLAISVITIWGINFSVIKVGMDELPPLLFSALRFLVVAIPAVFFVPIPNTSFWNILGVGLFLGVFKFGLLFFAMKSEASAGLSSLILQAQVFFTIGLSVLLLKETINRYQMLGILVGVMGFSLFIFNAEGNISLLGLGLILLAALFWGVSNLIMKQVTGVNLLHFMVWVSLIPPLPLFVLSYLTETNDPMGLLIATTPKTWLSLSYVSYLSTLLAFAIWGWLLKTYSAATVTPFALLIPVVGIGTSNLWLAEQLETIEILGSALIMFGLCICVSGKHVVRLFRPLQAPT